MQQVHGGFNKLEALVGVHIITHLLKAHCHLTWCPSSCSEKMGLIICSITIYNVMQYTIIAVHQR